MSRLGAAALRLPNDDLLLARLRTICLLLLLVILANSTARLAWALFTPPPEVPSAAAFAVVERTGSKAERAAAVGESAALGEKLAALHLFGQAQPRERAAVQAEDLIDAPETSLSLVLRGLVASSTGEGGLAIIAEKGRRGEEGVYGIGDQVPGNAAIEAIFVDRVILRRAGRLETLFLENRDEAVADPRGAAFLPSRAGRAGAGTSSGGGGGQQISRQYVNETLANLPALAREVEVHIHNPEGGRNGFRLVAPGGSSDFLKSIGLQNGDILYEINGIPLTDAGAAMVAFEQLREARDLNLVYERNGAPQQISVSIR